MNDQQKKAVEEAVKETNPFVLFRSGAEEVLNNPEKYGLIPYHIHANLRNKYTSTLALYDKHVGTPCEEIRHREEVERLKEENARLRSALRTIAEWSDDHDYRHGSPELFAEEILKGGNQ